MIYAVPVEQPDDLNEFRATMRGLLSAGIAPEDIDWITAPTGALFANPVPAASTSITVPRSFADLATSVIGHRDANTWSLLYQALWRIDQGERSLTHHTTDPLMHKLRRMATAIKHDQHRMTAFVRFREVTDAQGNLFIAWYEPRHRVLRRTADFFVNRFANTRFSILTPDLTLHWDQSQTRFAPGLQKKDAASADAIEDWWRRYYAAIFNPARSNTRLMRSHMPKHFWPNLPEASIIPELLNQTTAPTGPMTRPSSRI